ncbi:hypothetical protein GBK02_04635 [Dechloromonas sp. TW-R-39-2]|uniref:RDD family protein n=1 Tax=Dechloromonas sp. TW-R-39-2 TaxID=2654218 RepID=UPI00193DDE8F|nr:RDD family protein [Dechloromonas sp. TW-R-39-2]QRM18732.1 hypothetical protein GBK02_04635 [Dechloromonas sp. TW-R-39-2]
MAPPILPASSCLAPIKSRVLAYLIDLLIGIAALFLGSQIIKTLDTTNLLSIFGIFVAIAIVLGVPVYQAVLLSLTGQSIGKKMLKLRVVTFPEASNSGFARAVFKRWWLPSLLYLIPYLGWVFWMADCLFIFNKNRRCLHDLVAGTMVVQLNPLSDTSVKSSDTRNIEPAE